MEFLKSIFLFSMGTIVINGLGNLEIVKQEDCSIGLCNDSPIVNITFLPRFPSALKWSTKLNFNMSVVGVMPHTYINGYYEVFVNKWPYEVKLPARCIKEDPHKNGYCYRAKGDKINEVFHVTTGKTTSTYQYEAGRYIGNASLFNDDDALMLCLKFDCYIGI